MCRNINIVFGYLNQLTRKDYHAATSLFIKRIYNDALSDRKYFMENMDDIHEIAIQLNREKMYITLWEAWHDSSICEENADAQVELQNGYGKSSYDPFEDYFTFELFSVQRERLPFLWQIERKTIESRDRQDELMRNFHWENKMNCMLDPEFDFEDKEFQLLCELDFVSKTAAAATKIQRAFRDWKIKNEELHGSGNYCLGCGIDMGEENPRQYCYKTHCPEEYYNTF
tara:strand:+ start:908 stop:1591 length:684 start_codon:yes stop_codon:yes gene_type:complete